ncbi:MAG: nucleotidyltransferase [Promethearchaeia archaeon]
MSEKRNTKETLLNTLSNLKEKLNKKYRVKNIGLFGSYVNNEQKENSVVEFESDADLIHLIGLSNYLEKIFETKIETTYLFE